MDETSSSNRPAQPDPTTEAGPVSEQPASHHTSPPAAVDSPTVITGRPPIPSPDASDAAFRIQEGLVVPGDRMGQFELLEYVGGGGMGRVFRAMDTQLARTVALKILPPDQAADSDALQRFQNEAQSAARLDHENIARVYCVGEGHGLHFIVFEYIEGTNIRVLVERKGPLPLNEAISYSLQVAEALTHSDARSVVHRDIKPSNLLITPEGRVKLIDMGLARLRLVDPEVADLTASGVTLGTFDYISPEQARDPRNADIRSDIYSLGCTIFFMLTGQPPFPEGTVLQKLLQHQGDQPPDLRQFRPDVPDEVGRIVRKMMAKDPRHRYQTPVDLVADLGMLAEQIGLRPMSPASKVWRPSPEKRVRFFRRHLTWMAPIAALVCAVILLDRYWTLSAQYGEGIQPPAVTWPEETTPAPINMKEVARSNPTPALPSTTEPSAVAKASATSTSPLLTSEPQTVFGEAKEKRPWLTAESPDKTLASGSLQTTGLLQASGSAQTPGASATAPGSLTLAPTVPDLDTVRLPVGPPGDKSPLATSVAPLTGATPLTDAASRGSPAIGHGRQAANGSGGMSETKAAGILVVSDQANGENEYATLAAACSAARDGDVIELRYNGARPESPIKISNLQATIRAGEGYRPIILFQPTEVDPVKHPRSMLTLASGRLTLVNLAIELDVPRQVLADTWAMFEIRGGRTIRIERCSFTIRNASDQLTAYHSDVAFFRAMAATESEGVGNNSSAVAQLATLELADTIARGEADFLRVEDLQPIYLSWENGMLATTGRFLSAAGGQLPPQPDEILRLELHHITAVVRSGLCRLASTPADPYQLTAEFSCTNCIIMGTPGVAMIEQERTVNTENSRQHVVWNGNGNYYQDIDLFWNILGSGNDASPSAFNFDDWKAHWRSFRENRPSIERLPWQNVPPQNRALHTYGPADYTLNNPTADDTADDNAGANVSRLPQLPASSESAGVRNGNAG